MEYRLEDKRITLKNKRIIGQGKTGNVYKYDKDTAIKVFKNTNTPIKEETARYLSRISTDRIILPEKLLFYKNAFMGYSYKLVPKIGSGKRMIMLPKTDLVQDIRILERDVETLTRKKVLLSGMVSDNTIFNGELYLTDPTGYKMFEDCKYDTLEGLNKIQLHLLLVDIITKELEANNFSTSVQENVKALLNMKDKNENSSEFFLDIIYDNDTVKEFAKKLQ